MRKIICLSQTVQLEKNGLSTVSTVSTVCFQGGGTFSLYPLIEHINTYISIYYIRLL